MIKKWIEAILLITFSLLSLPAGADEVPSRPQTSKKLKVEFPPYPNVWGYEFPWREKKMRALQISVHRAPNGDYAVIYSPCKGCDRVGINFFSGKEINKKDLEKYFKQYISGSTPARTEIRFDTKLSWKMDFKCLFLDCCPDLSRYPLTKYNPLRTNEQLTVLYFIEDPYRSYYIDPPDNCIGKGAWQRFEGKFYDEKVFSARPHFVPLKDGTFLLYDDSGNFVIRLDNNLNSKSDLFNRNVFIVNTSDIEFIETALFTSNSFNRQTYDNTVALYIKGLKNGVSRETALEEVLYSLKYLQENYTK